MDLLSLFVHIITVGSVLIFKLMVLIIGFLIVKMGHDLLLRGIKGEFIFSAEKKGMKAGLISSSPGLLFLLLGVILLGIAVITPKPINFSSGIDGNEISSEEMLQNNTDKPTLNLSNE